MSDHTSTLSLQALPPAGGSALERVVSLLHGRLATALAVTAMWTLAVVDWLSIYAGNAPNRKIFGAILIIAAILAVGRIRLALIDKYR
ncbi:MAG TPA: hypothetical protein VFX89_18955 [Gammaproteobacteria bacterium]|nr:hypothetical protein [Gammaproteobacteria bacterium]